MWMFAKYERIETSIKLILIFFNQACQLTDSLLKAKSEEAYNFKMFDLLYSSALISLISPHLFSTMKKCICFLFFASLKNVSIALNST